MTPEKLFIKKLIESIDALESNDADESFVWNTIKSWQEAARDLTRERKTITIEGKEGTVRVSAPYVLSHECLSVEGFALLTIQQSEELIMAIRAMQNEVKKEAQ